MILIVKVIGLAAKQRAAVDLSFFSGFW